MRVESIREAHEAIRAEARAGRSHGGITRRSGETGANPDGRRTRIHPDDDATTQRSIQRENSGAAILAGQGYQIKQNPTPDEVAQARRDTGDAGDPASRPDYLLEGRVFDCYSPEPATNVRNIWSATRKKAVDLQAQRVVVNLQDWRGDLSALRKQFDDWPAEELKEVKAITPGGDIVQIVPRTTD
jgi:hypothetical protein